MIYLDHASTTPLDSEVLEIMLPYLKGEYSNPASQYSSGRACAQAVLNARDEIAKIFCCKSEEVYFVSGGTEAGNWALKGAMSANANKGRHAVISAIEHPALIESAKDLQKFGCEITFVEPNADGVISPESIENAIRPDTVFCAVMHANNETGVIQPVEKIGEICKNKGVFYYCDCVQTAGVLPLPTIFCDALGISAHKFYGPKGFGAVYISSKAKINRLISGGKQERGLRAGTVNTASAVGCAAALKKAYSNCEKDNAFVQSLRDRFLEKVFENIEGVHLNGSTNRLPSNANLSFDGCDGENILFLLDMRGIAVSTGSACSAGAVKSSHVLEAMHLPPERVRSAVRFTFGKDNTADEVDIAANSLAEVVDKIRNVK